MAEINFETGKVFAQNLDKKDALAPFRDAFHIPDSDLIYLDGNSLGRLPKATAAKLQTAIEEQWGRHLIKAWNSDWYEAPLRIGEKIARLAGAAPHQIIMSDSTSVNLFKLILAAAKAQPDRHRMVSDAFNFPSDLYILQGCLNLLGKQYQLHLVPSRDGITINREDLFNAIDEDTAVVCLSHVAFKSGFMYDAESISRHAHAKGALVLWDLCHSIGAVPVELDRWEADFAVGCTYKYLNGGPGSPAFLYVAERLQKKNLSPIWGWFSQSAPFSFDLDYRPADGIRRFSGSTPPMLSLLAVESALDPLLAAGIPAIRHKSVLLTAYLIFLFDHILAPYDFKLGSPRDPDIRGSHVSIQHPDGFRINQALIQDMNVLPDFREPDNIRLGLAPLYNSFSDIWEAMDRIRTVMEKKTYQKYSKKRGLVT
ncbi:MAG: kynureninase [Desulfobacteraceae bacterium]|nr:MAG: kynureninase [Desulfobacteraceae bacterium]